MSVIFLVLLIMTVVFGVLGLINPKLVASKGKPIPSRRNIAVSSVAGALVFLILRVVTAPSGPAVASNGLTPGLSNVAATTTADTANQSSSSKIAVSKSSLLSLTQHSIADYDTVYQAYAGEVVGNPSSQFLQLEASKAQDLTQLGESLPDASTIADMATRKLVVDTNAVIANAISAMADMSGYLERTTSKSQLDQDVKFYQQSEDLALNELK